MFLKSNYTMTLSVSEGWRPGIPEIAAIWDEDWDKFEDEGLASYCLP